MEKEGLAVASDNETTTAPETMYRDVEQDETVAKGCVRVTEVIAYDVVGKRKNEDGVLVDREKGRGPFFYQDSEDFIKFKNNNPTSRIETFGVQLLKSIAKKYIDRPENIEQFREGGDK